MSQPTALRTGARPTPRTAPRPGSRRATALRVVPEAIQRTGNAAFAGVCAVLLLAGLVALLMLNTSLAQGAFALSSLKGTSGQLADTQQQLTASIDQQRSPLAVAAAAQQLGMVPSQSMAFIRLSDGKIIGTAQPALPSQRLNIVTTPTATSAPSAPSPAAG